jgi:arabinose-5-phosphate isomerase
MKKENLPICDKNQNIKDTIHTMTQGKYGLAIVVEDKKIIGVITDGDIRRAMENNEDNFFALTANDLMSTNPKLINEDTKLIEASDMMSKNKINSLVVVDNNYKLSGIVQMYDLGI